MYQVLLSTTVYATSPKNRNFKRVEFSRLHISNLEFENLKTKHHVTLS